MVLNIIMSVTMYPTILIVYFLYKTMGVDKSNYLFGTTLKENEKNKEVIKGFFKEYKKNMRWVLLLAAFSAVIPWFIPFVSVQIALWIAWLTIFIFLLLVPYISENKRVLRYMNDNLEDEKAVRFIDQGVERTVQLSDFLPQIVINVIVATVFLFIDKLLNLDLEVWYNLPWLKVAEYVFVGITIILSIISLIWDGKKEFLPDIMKSTTDKYLSEKKRLNRSLMIKEAWLITGVELVVALTGYINFQSYILFMCELLVGSLIASLLLFLNMKSVQRVHNEYLEKVGKEENVSNEIFWKWGLIYSNPMDSQKTINNRFGYSTTMNEARIGAKIADIFGIVVCAVLMLMFVDILLAELSPHRLIIKDNVVQCVTVKVECSIEIDEEIKMSLIENPAPKSRKIRGFASDYFEEGTFSVENMGTIYEFLIPSNDLVIMIETDDKIYCISADTDEETTKIFHDLQDKCKVRP